ncbi:ribonuclease III [bacterium]|nr:ribonuclease III [bacterium]
MLSCRFKNESLLKQALTHRSYLDHEAGRNISNERLEFLGDAVLDLIVTEALYRLYPRGSEGELTKARASIVSRDSLAREAKKLGLGRYLFLGKGEERSGGRKRKSILSDVYEAILGAMFLDGGLDQVKHFLSRNLLKDLEGRINREFDDNYKSRLLEYVQARGKGGPEYRVFAERGPEHRKEFAVEVRVNGKVMGRGKGYTKRKAEQEAARQAIETLETINLQ